MMITLANIRKSFRVAKRAPGAKAALASLIHREYRSIDALDNISFDIPDGQIVGYIGPNGAGKSTSIKIMSGILIPDSGTCRVAGLVPWKERKTLAGRIGVVFGQRTQLWWDVPIADSYELLRDIYKLPKDNYNKTRDRLVDALDVGSFVNTPLRQVSLGQRMRAELVASLLHEPDVLFLDEPTIGLDAVSKLAVRQFIRQINAERGVTVLLTTHDMNDIEALADRVLMIGNGRILSDGSMDEVKRRYDKKRTITVSFETHNEPVSPPLCELVSWTDQRAVYSFSTDKTNATAVLAALSGMLSIRDMTSEGTPLEEIVAALYKEHGL